MKTKDAIRLAGGHSKDLAVLLGVTSSAISQWGDNIPSAREWQLKALRPDWFLVSEDKKNAVLEA